MSQNLCFTGGLHTCGLPLGALAAWWALSRSPLQHGLRTQTLVLTGWPWPILQGELTPPKVSKLLPPDVHLLLLTRAGDPQKPAQVTRQDHPGPHFNLSGLQASWLCSAHPWDLVGSCGLRAWLPQVWLPRDVEKREWDPQAAGGGSVPLPTTHTQSHTGPNITNRK